MGGQRQAGKDNAVQTADRIAWLCRQLADGDELERLADDAGCGPLLTQIRTMIRAGDADSHALDRALDELDEAMARVGLDGVTTPGRYHSVRPGALARRPNVVRQARICPQGTCSRLEPEDEAHHAPAPVCAFTGAALKGIQPPPIATWQTVPITIYLSDEPAHGQVQAAVEALLVTAGLRIEARDEPVLGSWFRRMRAVPRRVASSPLARDLAATAAHAAESRIALAQDAAVTATMLQNLGPLLTALQPTKDAAIRVGALLIIKVDWIVGVHQLTAAQQLELDHRPGLATSPHDIIAALELKSAASADSPAGRD
jgi:hypothetical protein